MNDQHKANMTSGGRAPFRPKDVDLSTRLCSTFGKSEVEDAACKLIQFLVDSGDDWNRVELDKLVSYYRNQHWNPNEALFGLFGPWLDDCDWSVREGVHLVHWGQWLACTHEFLNRISKFVHCTHSLAAGRCALPKGHEGDHTTRSYEESRQAP